MDFTDQALTCSDCGNSFLFSAGEQQFFHQKHFTNKPKRCKDCRQHHQKAGGNGSNGRPQKSLNETPVICAECGVQTTVPFKPSGDRPVLCRACFQGKRAQYA